MTLERMEKIIKERVSKQNKNIHSEAHYWADIISKAFGERKKFGMYLGLIKRVGVAQAQKIFTEIKDSKCKSPGKLFVWKTSQKNLTAKKEKLSNSVIPTEATRESEVEESHTPHKAKKN